MGRKHRGVEPSQGELEFIFRCMERGLEPSEILEEMQDEQFPVRQREFISRKRKYLDAARKVLEERIRSEQDPVVVQARTEHFRDLCKIGREFVEQLERVEEGANIGWIEDFERWWEKKQPHREDMFNKGNLGPFCWDTQRVGTGIPQPWFEIEAHHLFECLKMHIPDDTLWECFNELKEKIGRLLEVNFAIELDKHQIEIDEGWTDTDTREHQEWLARKQLYMANPKAYCDALCEQLLPLVRTVKNGVNLAVRRRVFPGSCPICLG